MRETSIGIDEAGLGPIAGPLVVAIVVVEPTNTIENVTDSKKMTPLQRAKAVLRIRSNAEYFRTIISTSMTIDLHGVSYVWQHMVRELAQEVNREPNWRQDTIILDGNRLVQLPFVKPVVKADTKVLSVSAASVLAKEEQCRWMERYHEMYPQYGFDRHKGYATPLHLERLEEFGPCPIHRMSFAPVKKAIRSKSSS